MKHLVVMAAAAALWVAAPAVRAQASQPIRIGIIVPLTGGSADMGNSARIGAEVADAA